MNLVEILKFTEEYLKKYSFSKPRLEAEKLVSYVLNLDRIALYIHYERELSEDEKTSIKQYLKKMTEENKNFDELKGEKKDYKEEKIEIKDEESDIDCDKCGRKMVYKIGRFGRFLACSRISRM